ncbi:hypothetical protein SteCoe_18106 [Stentor coeruleus]|uniref:Uncharacterized protein n=1 Tax=Stentor coeruleus TaxID=5963 RepID=A0A1R2BXA1_9CILI|nr:hypothetical protein SteCoe_18106 [Stentor coeruleus]
MVRCDFNFVWTSTILNLSIAFLVIYIQCFLFGILGYSLKECGVYIPAWLFVAGFSLSFFALFYALSLHCSVKSKSLTILYTVIAGVFVLFNIFLILVGDYTFSLFGSECSFKSYGNSKSRYVPYVSTIIGVILFNIIAVFGIIIWVRIVYHYIKKGINCSKKQEAGETKKEMSQDYMNENAKANENDGQTLNAKENCDDGAIIRDNYDKIPKIARKEKRNLSSSF